MPSPRDRASSSTAASSRHAARASVESRTVASPSIEVPRRSRGAPFFDDAIVFMALFQMKYATRAS